MQNAIQAAGCSGAHTHTTPCILPAHHHPRPPPLQENDEADSDDFVKKDPKTQSIVKSQAVSLFPDVDIQVW